MPDFNDMDDPALAAACNRLAAFCEALPAGVVIDDGSGLGEQDLVLILRRLYATRALEVTKPVEQQRPVDRDLRVSVPVTRGPWGERSKGDGKQERGR